MRTRRTILLSLLISGGMALQPMLAPVFANEIQAAKMDEQSEMIQDMIPFRHTEGDSNKFVYSPQGWEAGNDNHVWSKEPSDSMPASSIWYEVHFVGNAIEIYAGKNRPMGMVEYFIDGVSQGEFSLYRSSNIDKEKITSFENLEEGPHVLRAVATGKKDTSSTKALIDCSDVVITHAPYVPESITPSENAIALPAGADARIELSVTPSYAASANMQYASSDPTVASVDETGRITAHKKGSAVITITSGSASATVMVSVQEAMVSAASTIVDTNRQYTQSRYESIKTQTDLSATLSAWKGDVAVSQFVVYSKESALRNVRLQASDFTDATGHVLDASNISMKFIQSTLAYNGSYLGYGDPNRKVPAATASNRSEASDILSNADSVDVPFNALQPVWLEAAIPADAAAGLYTGKITITADDLDTPMELNYTLQVQNATLPSLDERNEAFDLELWQHPYSSAEYYGLEPFSDEHFDILRSIMNLYKEAGGHAITATISEDAWNGQTYSANDVHYPSMVRWTKNADGSFSYDFTNLDRWISFNKNEIGIGDKIVLYSIAPWHDSFTYWENGTLKKESFTAGSERYDTVWSHFLNALSDHMVAQGWFEDCYIGIDERGFSAAAFDLIDSVKNLHGESFKTAGAMDGFVNKRDLAMRVDDLNVGDNAAAAHPEEFAKLLADREAAGKRTTLYSCTEHAPGNFALSAPVESYWSIVNAGKSTAGFLRWAYDAWVEDPLRDTTHNAFEPGDCFLIYPDEKNAANPTSTRSLRLARMMEAARDVNKLRLIEKEVPSLKGEIDALYASIETTASTSRSYRTDAQIDTIADEMDTFKEGIATLTETYLQKKAEGSSVVSGVTITSEVTELMVGSTLQLSATVLPENVLDPRVEWSSSNEAIASISPAGAVSALQPGTVTITATSKADPTKSARLILTITRTSIPDEAYVSAYPFEESLNDTIGSRHGSVIGDDALLFECGRSGQAVRLKAGEGITLAGTSSIGENDPWSLTYWVKADEISGKSLVTQDREEKFATALKMASDRKAGFRVGTGNGDVLTFGYDFKPDTWYHIAWTQSKTDGLSLYVNGRLYQTNAWTKSNKTLLPADIIGKSDFAGLVDELHVFNKVLSAQEIQADLSLPGITLVESVKTIKTNETWQIEASLLSESENDSLTYTSLNPDIATVDESGLVTPHKRGTAIIRIASTSGKYVEEAVLTVEKYLIIKKTGPYYDLPEAFQSTVHMSEDPSSQYFGQPDMVRTKTGRLITCFPKGHGHGPLVMKISEDEGETWTEKTDIPASWATSQETPTLYVLPMEDGHERLILICGCPSWDLNRGGWNTSISDDNGETWSEFDHFHATFPNGSKRPTIVAMSSLIQLRDENGKPIQQWMGIYHNASYVNYKTILSFDEEGNEQWSEPEPILSAYRSIESTYQICEIGLFRSPDGNRIVGLARSQSHNNASTMFYSDDEGKTWSKPVDLPGNLAGERHKAIYDPISGRLFITFRDIHYDLNDNNRFDGASDWTCGEWVAWVGTYDDLMDLEEGDYLINLDYDYANNAKSGDTGYTGLVVLEDGTIIADTYGHWDEEYSKNWSGGVTTDRCYIRQVKFKLGAFEDAMGMVDKSELEEYLADHDPDLAGCPADLVSQWNAAKTAALTVLDSNDKQQCQVDAALDRLVLAYNALMHLDTRLLEAAIAKVNSLNQTEFASGALDEIRTRAASFEAIVREPENQKQIEDAARELNGDLLALRKAPSRTALEQLK